MTDTDFSRHPIARQFWKRFYEDRTRGRYSLTDYCKEWPGNEEIVAAAYAEASTAIDGAAPPVPSSLSAGDVFRQYAIKGVLGSGSTATVFHAHDVRMERDVALKVLSLTAGPDEHAVERLRREAAALSRLNHSGICRVFEADFDANGGFLATELLEGVTLAASRETIAPRDALFTVMKLARALHVAHQAGIVHRDLSPSNVVFRAEGDPVLVDFGLATFDDANLLLLTGKGDVVGTPAYMAPEQTLGPERIDGRSDVFSLGVILFELLAGQRPFPGATQVDLFQAIRHDALPTFTVPREIGDPRDVRAVLETALAKEPERRYQSAGAFADDLKRLLDEQPVTARRDTLWDRLRRWYRRDPRVAQILISLALILTATLLAVAVLLFIASRERDHSARSLRDRERAEQNEAAARAVGKVEEARRVARAGLVDEALASFQEALPAHPNPAKVRLEVIAVLTSSLEVVQARTRLVALLHEGVPAGLEARAALLAADLARGNPILDRSSVEWAERALARRNDLSAADLAWAQAMAATDLSVYREHVAEALARDPFHRGAHRASIFLSLADGRYGEAWQRARTLRAVVGDEPGLLGAELFCSTMLGRFEEAEETLRRSRLAADRKKLATLFLDLGKEVAVLDDALTDALVTSTNMGAPSDEKQMRSASARATSVASQLATLLGAGEGYGLLPLPEVDLRGLGKSTDGAWFSLPRVLLAAKRLNDLSDALPEAGILRMAQGLVSMMLLRYRSAHPQLLAGIDNRGLVPLPRYAAALVLGNFLSGVVAVNGDFAQLSDLTEGALKAARFVTDHAGSRPPDLCMAALVATQCDDPALGVRAALRARALDPKDPYIDRWLGIARLREGSYGLAVLSLSRFLAAADVDEEIKRQVRPAFQQARSRLGKIGPLAQDPALYLGR